VAWPPLPRGFPLCQWVPSLYTRWQWNCPIKYWERERGREGEGGTWNQHKKLTDSGSNTHTAILLKEARIMFAKEENDLTCLTQFVVP